MAFYTNNNLKIRLDENALLPVIFPLKALGKYEDTLIDLELWEMLPNAISSVVAILTAYVTRSWSDTLLFAVLGFYVGLLIQELFYSDLLKNLFPMFLGSWMVCLPTIGIVSFLLVSEGFWTCAIAVTLVYLANWFHISDFLMIFFMPISAFFAKKRGIGQTEFAFISICNRKAEKHGLKLDWGLYNQPNKNRSL